MKKILILAMMTLLFAVTALSTTAGNFFWVTSTFGTPTSLFGNSGGNDDPNPNVNPPFPPGDPSNWAVFATGGNNPDNPGGVFAFSGQGQSGGIHPHPQNNGGKVGTNANAKIGNQYPVDFGNKNATITPASDFYFGVGTTDKPALVSGTGAEAFAAAAHILKSYQTFDLPEWRDFTQNSYKSLFTKYDTIPDTLVTGYYQNLEISNNGTKNITVSASDVIILIDNLTIGNNGKISVTRNGDGRLFFLVTSALSGKGEIEVKQDGTPLTYDDKSFLFYNGASGFSNSQTFDIDFPGIVFLKSGEFNISNDSKQTIGGIVSRGEGDIDSTGANISALVYAPLADLKYGGNGDIEGTVIAKNIELKGNSGIRYKLIPIPKPEIPEPTSGTGYFDGVFIDTDSSFVFSGDKMGGANAIMIVRDSLITPQFNGGAHTGVSKIYIGGSMSMDTGSASFGSQSATGSIHVHGNLSLWNGTRDVYGDVYVNGNFRLKDAKLNGNYYINGDLELGWTPGLDSTWHIYYTGKLTTPNNYKQQVLSRCTKVDTVTLPQPIPNDKPGFKPDAWYISKEYITSGTIFNQNTFTSNKKFFVTSFSTEGWIPTREKVVIVSKSNISIGNMGGSNLSGILFAPNGKVTISNLNRFDGIIIAKEVLITTGGSDIYYRAIGEFFDSSDDFPF